MLLVEWLVYLNRYKTIVAWLNTCGSRLHSPRQSRNSRHLFSAALDCAAQRAGDNCSDTPACNTTHTLKGGHKINKLIYGHAGVGGVCLVSLKFGQMAVKLVMWNYWLIFNNSPRSYGYITGMVVCANNYFTVGLISFRKRL